MKNISIGKISVRKINSILTSNNRSKFNPNILKRHNKSGHTSNIKGEALDIEGSINKNISNIIDESYVRDIFEDMLNKSILKNASDIHIEPFEDRIVIRLRIDGVLIEEMNISLEVYQQLLVIIKLETAMDITEKRLPQDGRFAKRSKDEVIDVRVSTLPTVHGEKVVLRILNRKSFLRTKEELGFDDKDISKIESIINKKSGILLVTGATGSGKTTTVYSIINDLKSKSKNIMTIEDPVEYKMDGVNQIQVNNKVGLGFDKGLRSILRQDPDIIMVGEIRDKETAKIAMQAATTGHLVISTMHTKDSISAISRLIDMDIEPYLINSSLIGVISQKLIRKVCNECSTSENANNYLYKFESFKSPVGCDNCNLSGYKGRTAVYEILEINDDIRQAIKDMKDYKSIKEIAVNNGMVSFKDSGERLIQNNITTLEEYISIESES